MPNFISVIVLCGIVRVLLSVTGPVNGLFHTGINFMTLPEAFRPIYIISGIWQGAGWSSIMYTAALSNASQELKEAAMLENERNTWNGRAIAMSRSKRKNGQITVKVGPEGMPQAVLKLRAE